MGRFRKIILTLVCIMAAGLLGGCTSDADAKAYLQALLDASYKNDSAGFVGIKLGTQEEAEELYEQGIDAGVGVFCSRLGISDEYKAEFRQLYMDMLRKVRYSIGDAKKQSDGSFVVTVSYEKMNIFKPALELYLQDVAAMTEEWAASAKRPPQEEMVRAVVLQFRASMEKVLADVQYSAPDALTVKIELDNNVYTPNADDVAKLERSLFDGE